MSGNEKVHQPDPAALPTQVKADEKQPVVVSIQAVKTKAL